MNTVNLDRMNVLIAGLLSKTVENGCTESEAASALEKAQELLLRYNLSEQSVRTHADGNEELRTKVGQQDVDVAGGFKWRASLLAAIARANLCRIVISDRGERGTVHVFGKQQNIRVVLDMWEWVSDQLERLGARACATTCSPPSKLAADGTATPGPWKPKGDEGEYIYLAGFYRAAVQRIDSRLAAAMSRFTAEFDMTRALVVNNGTELSTAVRRAFPNLGRWGGMPNSGRDGMRDGARAGDRVKLTRDPALNAAGGASLRLGVAR